MQAYGEQHPANARQRQREINTRLARSQYLLDLDRSGEAIPLLRGALEMASADVVNDPSQPKRQAMLARLGYTLARVEAPQSHAARSALETADQGLAAVSRGELPGTDGLALAAMACVARAHVERSASCASQMLDEVLSVSDPAGPEFRLADRAGERLLARMLAAVPPIEADRLSELDARIEALLQSEDAQETQ